MNKIALAVILTGIYDYLFWDQTWGVNIVMFDLVVIPIMVFLNKESLTNKNVWATVSGTFITAILVLMNGSDIAKCSHLISFTVMMGFIHQSGLRTVYNSFLTGFADILHAPVNYMEEFNKRKSENVHLKKLSAFVKLCLIPLIILSVFYWIFKFANPVFDSLSSKAWNIFFDFIGDLFVGISISRFFFLVLGLFIVSGIVFRGHVKGFLNLELPLTDAFVRIKSHTVYFQKSSFGKLYKQFNNEFRIGILTIGMVNLLLLIINIIDIKWIWFDFEYSRGFNLSQFVHEGTYLLILSILISMGIILHFFRGNINLFRKNKSLKILAYIWIFQNAILVISVAIRNYYYIEQCGLAYKRIGVVIFLFLVLIGLCTLVVKINAKKSSFYLFRINSWSIYFVMVLICFINWDILIARHNMSRPDKVEIDKDFLLSLSDKTLYLLNDNKDFFSMEVMKDVSGLSHEKYLEHRINTFIANYQKKEWQSFDFADYRCYQELIKNHSNNK